MSTEPTLKDLERVLRRTAGRIENFGPNRFRVVAERGDILVASLFAAYVWLSQQPPA